MGGAVGRRRGLGSRRLPERAAAYSSFSRIPAIAAVPGTW
jgi:hypothetical protein